MTRDAASLFRDVIDAVAALVLVLDRDGHVVHFNAQCRQASGREPHEVLGRPFESLGILSPEDAARLRERLREGCPGHHESRWIAKDGTRRLIRCSLAVLPEKKGRTGRFVLTGTDETARRELEEQLQGLVRSEARARARAETIANVARALNAGRDLPSVARAGLYETAASLDAPDGAVFLFDDDGATLTGVLEILSAGRTEVTVSLDEWPTARAAVETRRPVYVGRDEVAGTERTWCEHTGMRACLVAPLLVGERCLGLLVLDFPEDRGRPPPEDLELAAMVAAQCGLAVDRARAYEAARSEAELRERFMAILGHDLRSPLGAVLGGLEQLAELGGLSEDQAWLVERMTRSARRMRRMISGFVDFVRSRAGGLAVAPVKMDLAELARSVVEEERAAHPRRRIELDAGPLPGEWDPDALSQVLTNLVDNAVRFAPEKTPVWVAVRRTEDGALLTVQNWGEPIAPERLPGLFEPFKSVVGHGGGLGLGLYIVREIARAHGGEAEIRSDLVVGTLATVHLPLQPEVRPEAQA